MNLEDEKKEFLSAIRALISARVQEETRSADESSMGTYSEEERLEESLDKLVSAILRRAK